MELVSLAEQYCLVPCVFHDQLAKDLRGGIWRYEIAPVHATDRRLDDTLRELESLVESCLARVANEECRCIGTMDGPDLKHANAVRDKVKWIVDDSRRAAGLCILCMKSDRIAEQDRCDQDHEIPYDF